MNGFVLLILVALIAGLPGCSGTFTAARLDGAPRLAVSLDPPECVGIETARRNWDGASKVAAFAGGTAGLAAIPVHGEIARAALIGAGVGVAAFGVYAMVEADAFAKDWVRQCGATGVR
jgi:hypothetical protein